jgi:hypothetical protein
VGGCGCGIVVGQRVCGYRVVGGGCVCVVGGSACRVVMMERLEFQDWVIYFQRGNRASRYVPI